MNHGFPGLNPWFLGLICIGRTQWEYVGEDNFSLHGSRKQIVKHERTKDKIPPNIHPRYLISIAKPHFLKFLEPLNQLETRYLMYELYGDSSHSEHQILKSMPRAILGHSLV